MLKDKIKEAVERIDLLSRSKKIKVVSHFDTDGITSAAIFVRALTRWEKNFSLEIVKGLEENFIRNLPEDEILIFLDLASGSLGYLGEKKTEIFVFDHHEIPSESRALDSHEPLGHEFTQEIPKNIFMVNATLEGEHLSSAAICYLFAREISVQNKDLGSLAVIGMVGDLHEKNISKIFSEILDESGTILKKGLMIYPSTRPLNRALEYSSSPYVPGVTGSREGVLTLLRDANLIDGNGQYKALYELNEDEMTRLVTAIVLKCAKAGRVNQDDLVGNLFLVKFFNKLEDARELSASINACSRMGYPEVALGFCLGNKNFKDEAEKIYIDYKQSLVSALKYVSETGERIEGKDYLIINARDKIKDTIIGTVASILSHSPIYPEGLVIIALAYDKEKIKVSARLAGRTGRNVREVLHRVVVPLGGEVGGHPNAAGCLIPRSREKEFISELRRVLDLEVVKV